MTRPASVSSPSPYTRDAERGMAFVGFLTFIDRPKEAVAEAIAGLSSLGVTVKAIEYVAATEFAKRQFYAPHDELPSRR